MGELLRLLHPEQVPLGVFKASVSGSGPLETWFGGSKLSRVEHGFRSCEALMR